MKKEASEKTILQDPPTISGGKWLTSLLGLRSDMPAYVILHRQQYGDIYRLKVGSIDLIIVTSPELARHVLVENNRNYVKSFGYEVLKTFLGEGLLTSEGEFWKQQRRLAQPAFHKRSVENFVQIMAEESESLAAKWETLRGKEVEVGADMMRITMNVVARSLFSMDVSAQMQQVSHGIDVLNDWSMRRLRRPFNLPLGFPSPGNLRARRAIRSLDEVIYGFIAARRSDKTVHEDLLGMYMNARDEDSGTGMSDQQLRDEMMTLFIAGHETTAVALSWTWFLLSQHPQVKARVIAEIERELQGRRPVMADLPRLQYLTQVINESMRLYPPAWVVGRKALEPDELGGYRVKKGANVLVIAMEIHRHPAFWEHPLVFDPDRFAPERETTFPHHAYLPFGAGQRMCIGHLFAMAELQVILATLLPRFDLEYEGPVPPPYQPLITLRPKDGMVMRLR